MIFCPLKAAESSSIAWIEKEKVWTYRELGELADFWTKNLEEKGVKPLSRIAVLSPPTPALVALFFAAWRLGVGVCPLNTRLPKPALQKMVQNVNADLYLDAYEDPSLFFPKTGCKTSLSKIDPLLPALYLATSGSTAEPKIAVLTLQNLLKNAEGAIPLLDLREQDAWLLQLPLFHVGGIGILIRSILARAIIVTDPSYSNITHISCIPTHLYRASPVYKKLRCVLVGGAPITECPTYLPIIATYGLTEMGSMVLAQSAPSDGYLGHALPYRKVKVAEDGEIWVGGECLFQGYLERETIAPPGEWFATKDLGELDPTLGIKILGRKDWQFISGGENIQPEEIEQHMMQIPGIQEVAVVPKDDPEFGKRPVAFIKGHIELKRLREILSLKLPKYKIPIDVISLQQMPRLGIKIDRKSLIHAIS